MSRIRKQIVAILARDGWVATTEKLHPAAGYWRTSPYADVYRWEGYAVRPESRLDTPIFCWQTMTEFVRLANKYGFSYNHNTGEICANESQPVKADCTWHDITCGSNWRNKTTGRSCTVQRTLTGPYGYVRLLHETGRETKKQIHYFLYDYEKLNNTN